MGARLAVIGFHWIDLSTRRCAQPPPLHLPYIGVFGGLVQLFRVFLWVGVGCFFVFVVGVWVCVVTGLVGG
jgi:hypothetical protein